MFRLISGLIEPDESLVDPDDRHRSRLLTTMLTFVVPVGVVAVGVAQWVDGGRPDVRAVELVALLLMCALVPLSRGRHYRWGVLGFVGVALIMLCYVIVEAPAERAPVNASYMLVPVIAVSAMLSTRAAVVVLGLNVFLILALGYFSPRAFGLLTTHVLTNQIMVGGFVIIAGVFRDLLAEKKREDLAHREQRHRALLRSTFDGTADVDDGIVVAVRDGFGDLFGLEDGQIVGQSLVDFFPFDESVLRGDGQLSSRGQLLELTALHSNGRKFPVEAVFQGQARENGAGIVVAIRDISERRELIARMQITDRLAAMGMLAAGVAHEINNPLAYVSGNLQRAVAHLDDAPPLRVDDMRAWLESASDGMQRVGRIVGDLNTFSRDLGDEAPGTLDVKEAVEASVSMGMAIIGDKATLVREHEHGVVALADTARLGQVVLNLLVNAAQALPVDNVENNRIRISTFEDDGEAVIEVCDNGSGIPPAILTRIFEPFFTTKPVGVGTGLGLSICKNLVERMGGVMEVELSARWTTFRIRLNLATGPVEGNASIPEQSATEFAGKGRILVVDDEKEIANILVEMLEEHEVDVCSNGQDALLRIETSEYDLVLCDLMMPHMTGMELYDVCVAKHPATAKRFLFLSGGAVTPLARAFLDKVGCQRIRKPFRQAEILGAVRSSLETWAVRL